MIPTRCRACASSLAVARRFGDYLVCPECGTANLNTFGDAEEDNRRYFSQIFSTQPYALQRRSEQFWRLEQWSLRWRGRAALERYRALLDEARRRIVSAPSAIEIGFGSGDELRGFLDAGANLRGVDLAETAVARFRARYPEWADRVSCGSLPDEPVSVIYANALFEHLDEPGAWLDSIKMQLDPCGTLLFRLPLLVGRIHKERQVVNDINFWVPCHRALYTLQGLSRLLADHGLTIRDHATHAYFGYRVMNRLLDLGYNDILQSRNPCAPLPGLTSEKAFLGVLLQALLRKTLCEDGVVIAERVGTG